MMKKRDQIKKKEIIMMIMFVVISIFLSSILAEATTNEVEDIDVVNVQAAPIKQQEKQKQHTDPFTIAIIGLSFGCMMIASTLHWNMTQRKELKAEINNRQSFLANTCAVECHIKGCLDADPMMNAADDIHKRRDAQIEEYQNNKNTAAKIIADIETKIMRIWG